MKTKKESQYKPVLSDLDKKQIKTFCSINKIDPTSEIEGREILEIAKKNKRINDRFNYELRVLFPTEEF